jgi:hypothetical protein
LRGADLAHPWVRSRRRARTRTRSVWQRVSPAIVFDYEDNLNTLRIASQVGPTLILPYPDVVSHEVSERRHPGVES